MRNIWLVVKHDVRATLAKRSFWVFTLLVPVLLVALYAYQAVHDADRGPGSSKAAEPAPSPADLPPIGLVDEGGLIAHLPPELPPDFFVRFPDQAAARAALEAGQVAQYVHLPADYLATGRVTVYDEDFRLLSSGEDMGVAYGSNQEWVLRYVIDYNLVGDARLLARLQDPVPWSLIVRHALRPAVSEVQDQGLAEFAARLIPLIYYALLVMGAGYLMRAVVAEKENRTAEVLLLSLPPRQLMVGKMVAMSAVMGLQVAAWAGTAILAFNRGAELLNVTRFDFPPGFLVWALLFLLLGYLLYASVMAAAGAIAPSAREAGQATVLLILPLLPTMMFASAFMEAPNGALAVSLSLIPFSAPSAMVTRLAMTPVPLWQILVSLAGLALTAYLFIVLAARFFRAGNLLSQDSFSWRRLATGWRRPG
jgi:ABC-2 type transport system permease protein